MVVTQRQLEVLDAVLEAGSVKGAATALDLAEATVKAHLRTMRVRNGCSTNAQLVWRLRRKLERHRRAHGSRSIP